MRDVGSLVGRGFIFCLFGLLAAAALTGSLRPAWAEAPPGTRIDNVALATYLVAGTSDTLEAPSNEIRIVVTGGRTPATLEYLGRAPWAETPEYVPVSPASYSPDGDPAGPFRPVPNPEGVPSPGETEIMPFVSTVVYHLEDTVYLRLTDRDQDRDPGTVETVVVTVRIEETEDLEVLLLHETGPGTGVFTGFVRTRTGSPGIPHDGVFDVNANATLDGGYQDPQDPADVALDEARVAPVGRAFDSRTGAPVSGARISLVHAGTGAPAEVRGDEPGSKFPPVVITGETVADDHGRPYRNGAGEYRFPLVDPGSYRLRVEPPPGYRAPSTVATTALQQLPGAPFEIAEPGSREEAFTMTGFAAVAYDIPLDPDGSVLGLQKSADRRVVGQGDFVAYTIRVENQAAQPAPTVQVVDELPPGFRYRSGSTRRNGEPAADPSVAPDGRTLTFEAGDLEGGGAVSFRYVCEVGAGSPATEAINTARARSADGVESNHAQAVVRVREDLFRGTFIVGRVVVGDCDTTLHGLPGVRILLEDGTMAVTDEGGRYHFEGVTPGTHVVQLDRLSLPDGHEPFLCKDTNRFAEQPTSQFVSLIEGGLWRADFRVSHRAPRAEVGLRLEGLPAGDRIRYRVTLDQGALPVANRRLTVALPAGVAYEPGSSAHDGRPLNDPEILDNMVTFRLGTVAADTVTHVEFTARPGTDAAELTARAYLLFDTGAGANGRTPVAECTLTHDRRETREAEPDLVLRPRFAVLSADLGPDDRAELDAVAARLRDRDLLAVHVTGHTDSVRIAPTSRHLFADNQALSLARARSVARYLRAALGPTAPEFTVEGRGADDPVAPNRTPEGRALNRRVEVRLAAERVTRRDAIEAGDPSPRVSVLVETTPSSAARTAVTPAPAAAGDPAPEAPPVVDEAWLDRLAPGTEWIWPPTGHLPPIPSLKVVVKHAPGAAATLLRAGEEVNALNFQGTRLSTDRMTAVSVWTGVDLDEGDNRLTILLRGPAGGAPDTLQRTIHLSGSPVSAELVPERSRLVADGRTPPVLAVRLRDRTGAPARAGVIGGFEVDPPHASRGEMEALRTDPLNGIGTAKPGYEVGPDGIALIELEPTPRAGEAVLRFNFERQRQEVRAWLHPEARDWILVGFAEGTAGYRALSGHQEGLDEAGLEEDYYADGRLAFYAQGRIKGEWLLTLAYDTDGRAPDPITSLHQTIDPDTYYTLYGDRTGQFHDAASARRLYVRIERRQFYALYGDLETGLNVTDLSRYQRALNGFRAESRGRYAGFNVFAADTESGFMREEIRGDGTSGLYRLARADVVINSEEIVLETRDRFRSEVVLDRRPLKRHLDYNIDYVASTLFFRSAVPSKDENLNPVFIVVDYEVRGVTASHLEAGGRGSLHLLENRVELGGTYIHEDLAAGDNRLAGADLTWRVDAATEVRAEAAWTERLSAHDGRALLAEVNRRSGRIGGSVYYQRLSEQFGLGQQNRSERGMEKYGADLSARVTERHHLTGLAYRHRNLATDARRDVGELGYRYEAANYGLRAGMLGAQDRLPDRANKTSTQALVGADARLWRGRLRLRADRYQSLGSRNANPDYPTRTLLGLDVQVLRDLSAFAVQEFTDGSETNTAGTRVGLDASPWTGGRVATSVGRRPAEYGPRLFANVGLAQAWRLSERWFLDAALDHSRTVGTPDSVRVNPETPPASGGDFTAVSLGGAYYGGRWQTNARIEWYDSDGEDRWGLVPAVLVQPGASVGLAAGGRFFLTDGPVDRTLADVRLGLSLRPDGSPWTLLQRLDLVLREEKQPDSTLRDERIVGNLHVNRLFGRRSQVGAWYGGKYVVADLEGDTFSGYTHLLGLEFRQDFGGGWDLGLHGGALHSWESRRCDYYAGISAGYVLLEGIWAQVGYNVTGFHDEDFTESGYTARGPYVRLSAKFDADVLSALGLGYRSGRGDKR